MLTAGSEALPGGPPGDGQDTASKARADRGMAQDQRGNTTLLTSQRTRELPFPLGGTEQDAVVQSIPATTSPTSSVGLLPLEKFSQSVGLIR